MKNEKIRSKKRRLGFYFLVILILASIMILTAIPKMMIDSRVAEKNLIANILPEIIREQEEEIGVNRLKGNCRGSLCLGTEGPDWIFPMGRQIRMKTWIGNYNKKTGQMLPGKYSLEEGREKDQNPQFYPSAGGINCYQLSKITFLLKGGADQFQIPCAVVTYVWAGEGDDRGVLGAPGPIQKSPTKNSKGKPIPNSNRNKIFGGDGNDNTPILVMNTDNKAATEYKSTNIKGLNGGGAPDMICGGPGEDYIAGHDGDDIIKGEEDKDEIYVNKKGNKGTVEDKAEANAPKDDESNTEIVYGCPDKSEKNCDVEQLNPPLSPNDINCAESEPAETIGQGSRGPGLPPVA